MKFKKIFITGMFRSGTTFIAKTLNSHKNFTVSSDAFFSAFKFLRNDFLNIKNYHEPFDDYLYSCLLYTSPSPRD